MNLASIFESMLMLFLLQLLLKVTFIVHALLHSMVLEDEMMHNGALCNERK